MSANTTTGAAQLAPTDTLPIDTVFGVERVETGASNNCCRRDAPAADVSVRAAVAGGLDAV